MDTDVLEELGLTDSEIQTYIALLELGSAHAGDVMDKTGLPNSVLHRALKSLINKSIISYIQDGRIKIYQATDPEQFFSFLEDKRERFARLLPALKEKQMFAEKKETVTIFRGVRGIKEVYAQLLEEDSDEYNSFGGGQQCSDRMGLPWWMNLHTRRVEKKLPSRQVFDESVRTIGGDILSKPMTNVRFLPAEFSSFQETVIVGDVVAISVFTENAYSFLIRDPVVAKSYKNYFDLLWDQAKP